jgi:hypothetical protein
MASQTNEMIFLASDALLELRESGQSAHVVDPSESYEVFQAANAIPTPSDVDEETFVKGLYRLYLGERLTPSATPYREGGSSPLDIQIGYVHAYTAQRQGTPTHDG